MPKSEPKNKSSDNWWQPALLLFLQLSSWIAIPVLIAVFLGQWLDTKYGTEPWLFLVTVGLAFIISMFGLVKEASQAIKKIEKENQKNKKHKLNQDE